MTAQVSGEAFLTPPGDLSALVARAINLQVVDTEYLQDQGEARYLRDVTVPTPRGNILDRNGEPLAVSTPVDSLGVNPGKLLQAPEGIARLAAVLEADADAMERRITQRAGREFVWIRRRLHPDVAAAVRALELPGVHIVSNGDQTRTIRDEIASGGSLAMPTCWSSIPLAFAVSSTAFTEAEPMSRPMMEVDLPNGSCTGLLPEEVSRSVPDSREHSQRRLRAPLFFRGVGQQSPANRLSPGAAFKAC